MTIPVTRPLLRPLLIDDGSLISYYVTDGDGNFHDISGRELHGTIVNATTGGYTAKGRYGQAYDLNATGAAVADIDSAINFGTPSVLLNLRTFSLALWMYPRTSGGNNNGRVFQQLGGTLFFFVGASPNQTLQYTVDCATTDVVKKTSTGAIPLNQWSHVVLACDLSDPAPQASEVNIYINGTEAGYSTQTNGVGAIADDSASDKLIGNNTGAGSGIRGGDFALDSVAFFNKRLSAIEVKELYDAEI